MPGARIQIEQGKTMIDISIVKAMMSHLVVTFFPLQQDWLNPVTVTLTKITHVILVMAQLLNGLLHSKPSHTSVI